jgi:hypothetical protein
MVILGSKCLYHFGDRSVQEHACNHTPFEVILDRPYLFIWPFYSLGFLPSFPTPTPQGIQIHHIFI